MWVQGHRYHNAQNTGCLLYRRASFTVWLGRNRWENGCFHPLICGGYYRRIDSINLIYYLTDAVKSIKVFPEESIPKIKKVTKSWFTVEPDRGYERSMCGYAYCHALFSATSSAAHLTVDGT